MEYISNNQKLNKAIIQFYNREIDPYILGEIYFKYNQYSAAATYYSLQLNNLLNCDSSLYITKSYCFSKLAECYYNQQIDHKFSDWQLSLIHDMCKEAISYNRNNIVAYLLLIKCFIFKNEIKNAYYILNNLVLNLEKMDELSSEYAELFIEIILTYFDLCENCYIIKYDNIYKSILKFILKYSFFTYEHILKINDRYNNHMNNISYYESDIMNGNINKYY